MPSVDVRQLEARLTERLQGEVRFDAGTRALYARDASNYRHVPYGVVFPRDERDVIETVAACRAFGAPITGRGGGTSLAGQACNVAVVMDFTRHMDRVLDIDPANRNARVQPGVVLDTLRDAVKAHGLTFGPDPSTHNRCTLGGMIGNNACGAHAQMAGCTADNVERLRVLTVDGEIRDVGPMREDEIDEVIRQGGPWGERIAALRDLRDEYADRVRARYPDIPRRISGYNLDALLPENGFHLARALVGTEGTCVTVLEATVRLIDEPKARAMSILGFDDIALAGDAVPDVLRESEPIALEAVDAHLVAYMRKKGEHLVDLELMPEASAYLIAEFGGDSEEDAIAHADRLNARMRADAHVVDVRLCDTAEHIAEVWDLRESGLGATARVPGQRDTWPGWEDSAVDPARLGDYLRELRALLEKYGYDTAAVYGHFGQGCVHARIPFDLRTADGVADFRAFVTEAARLAVDHGGSLSGEHGDGQARSELLDIMFGSELVDAFHRFKRAWDPLGLMNPGRIVDPRPLDADLQLGTGYAPAEPRVHFGLPEDRGKFSRATERCVGVGACRRDEGEVMCPSFMVTREEKHSTRGRAHLLNEMLRGDVIQGGWRSEEVKDALDLCLACKGCKTDCPVNVDMATYKAEFFSHYYEGRLRPASAYAMGYIHKWARLAALAPRVANLAARNPFTHRAAKAVAGIAPERDLPQFAKETFRAWYERRGSRVPDGPRVVLWPDTFHDHFHPEAAKAAVTVLETAGCHVVLPAADACCGRPLYDYGLLDDARKHLRRVLDVLGDDVRAGTPVIGLEPSCTAVFRDELGNLLAGDEDAVRLGEQTLTLAEYLESRDDVAWPTGDRKILVKTHCHQHAIMGNGAERRLLERIGITADFMASTCCGLAGSFGFEAAHYDVSMRVGEHGFLPAIRAAPEDVTVVADGFSCRTQAEHGTHRTPVHLAQVLADVLERAGRATPGALASPAAVRGDGAARARAGDGSA